MLDVHAPHGKMHGFGDFLLHLLTITIGLLIAVGIEGCVERRHHVHLATEARETMRTEIEQNAKTLDKALLDIKKQQSAMRGNSALMTRIQRNPKDPANQDLTPNTEFNLTSLEDTAWRTAQATGALAWMPYSEAQRFSSVYAFQAAFATSQDKILQNISLFSGLDRKFDLGTGRLTQEEAASLNERFGIWQGDLLLLDLTGTVAAEADHALLEGRPMRENIHESLRGQ